MHLLILMDNGIEKLLYVFLCSEKLIYHRLFHVSFGSFTTVRSTCPSHGITIKQDNVSRALIKAARQGNEEIVALMLSKGADINYTDEVSHLQ